MGIKGEQKNRKNTVSVKSQATKRGKQMAERKHNYNIFIPKFKKGKCTEHPII